ncbi:alpha/beta-hydrolase [Dichomitus squalens LYAD-421 SS1]|uniref:Alpha/beta-hydrolase n=1 Tax=Dichomitus squalens (strain LYAD-421) TaxID=732165 RepID=R7SQC4_DICSQ|nr:alpha/beta-hydrolase [Dichomitus squalens LYAD-421 SS1]EJF58128.1 alpha/beta-hydrolase [Dichomitus squalens LYAD-421 SS1]
MFGFLSTTLLALAGSAAALPALKGRDATELSASALASYAPFTQFARAAYCDSSKIIPWNCGEACAANADFEPSLTGGDGNDVQLYFVGYWPDQNAVVVAHEGTDPTQFLSDLTDVDIPMENLNSDLFPGVSSDVQVHSGFANEHAKTATIILDEVKKQLSSSGASTVIAVGHSLGGALSELDALFFTLNLPSSVHVKAVTYGTPRVGNPAWATLFDSKVSDFVRIDNEKDPVPIVPGRFLGFQHPHGEIHIVSPGEAYSCPGDDDATDPQCTISQVPNIAESNILDHLGPYEGIYIGTLFCT